MTARVSALLVVLFFCLAFIACNKEPGAPASSSPGPAAAPGQAQTAQEPSPSAPAGNAEAGRGSKHEAAGSAKRETGGARAEGEAVTLPAGTTITVRLGQTLGSKTSHEGETFDATVAQPIERNGVVVIPAGAKAVGRVTKAQPLGRFKGGAALGVKLVSINVNGKEYQVQTSGVSRSIQGKGKRTAVMTGGGAGLGAIVGGLAGGGKGAAIGALAGAGAGGAGAAFTGNKDIVLPAESALSFKLEEPLTVR
jgi:hypothetical protein